MRNVTRKKEVAVAVAMAILTAAAVAKGVGSDIAAAFMAGVGAAATVGYVVIANITIKQGRNK